MSVILAVKRIEYISLKKIKLLFREVAPKLLMKTFLMMYKIFSVIEKVVKLLKVADTICLAD